MEGFDFSHWVRSPEISAYLENAYLEGTWGRTTEQQEYLVLNACRPLEEKIDMLWQLQRFAESDEAREQVKASWLHYKMALEDIRQSSGGDLYIRMQREEDHFGRTDLFSSWQALMENSARNPSWSNGCVVEKYRVSANNYLPVIRFTLGYIDDKPYETDFAISGLSTLTRHLQENAAIEPAICRKQLAYGIQCPLPFCSGDLLMAEIPHYEEPFCGVLLHDRSGTVDSQEYVLGYVRDGRFDWDDMSLTHNFPLRPIDCLQRAQLSDFPESRDFIDKLSKKLRAHKGSVDSNFFGALSIASKLNRRELDFAELSEMADNLYFGGIKLLSSDERDDEI